VRDDVYLQQQHRQLPTGFIPRVGPYLGKAFLCDLARLTSVAASGAIWISPTFKPSSLLASIFRLSAWYGPSVGTAGRACSR
jgi:hypothetical protein